jgi:hypothetical protein
METPPKLSILFHTGGTLMEVTPLGEGAFYLLSDKRILIWRI